MASALAGFACIDITGGGTSGGGGSVPVATALLFQTQPSGGVVDSTLVSPVRVAVVDQNGNVVASAKPPITVALFYNPTGATLSGTTTVAATSGVATFSDLRLDKAGQGYRMVARAAGLDSVTSTPFTITP